MILVVAGVALVSAACLDALYEDVDPGTGFTPLWVVCCQSGHVYTCPCDAGETCMPNLQPCAGGACVSGTAGTCGGGGSDGGTTGSDGGSPNLDGGSGGGDGGSGDGGETSDAGPAPQYELCCTSLGTVSTCACAAGGCDGGAFVACGNGRCVMSGACP